MKILSMRHGILPGLLDRFKRTPLFIRHAILLLVFCAQANAQIDLDSIRSAVHELPASEQINYCLTKIRETEGEESVAYLSLGRELAIKHQDLPNLISFYIEEAIMNNISGSHARGISAFEIADSLAQIVQDTVKLAAIQTNLGLSHFYAGSRDKALQHYFQAYEYYEHIEVPKGKSRLLNNLAICSKELGHLPEAGKYYRESLEIKLALADSLGQARTLMNYGLLLAEQGQNEEGIDSVLRAQEIYRQLGRREDAYHCDLSLGKMMMDLGQWERAEPHLLSAHRFFSGDDRKGHELMLASSDLAQLAIAKNNWRLSDQFLQEAESIARKYGKLEDLRDILSTRSVAATEMGRSSLALETLQESYQLSDSINELTRLQLTEEMQTRFGVKEQEQQIALLNAKNEIAAIRLQTTKNRNTVLIFGLGLFALLSLIIYRLYDEVKGQKDLINVSLREKESLLKEIHHRVKNNLQVISSLLSMQSYQTKDTLVLDAVKESQNRVKTMALIHQNLYQDTDISAVDSLQYIDDLTKNLFNSYNIDQDKIELQTDIESISLDVDIMIPLGLILNELISNALKYAFRGGRSGLIEVKLQQQQKTLELTVADNGLGLPTDFSLENSSSMGMTLIQDFSRKLKANLKVLSDSGTKVILSIPFKSVK